MENHSKWVLEQYKKHPIKYRVAGMIGSVFKLFRRKKV